MYRGENEAIAREDHLVPRIENGDRAKLGHSEKKRIVKVNADACMRMDNRHESFDLF